MAGSEKEAILNVFAALVRPLMRAAFEYGITASDIAAVVRRTFIQALEARLVEQRRPITEARLAIVSGLTKSDVSALREALRSGDALGTKTGASPDQIASLLTAWHTHSNFSGAYGLALDVDIRPMPGSPRRSFQELVDASCPGADREALLEALITAGAAEIVDTITVRCLSRAFVQKGSDVHRIERTGQFLAAVADNFVHNLLRNDGEPIYFERAVAADLPMSDAGRDLFLAEASDRGQALLTELDTYLTALSSEEPVTSGRKYGVGIYFFEDQSDVASKELGVTSDPISKDGKRATVQEIDVLTAANRKQ